MQAPSPAVDTTRAADSKVVHSSSSNSSDSSSSSSGSDSESDKDSKAARVGAACASDHSCGKGSSGSSSSSSSSDGDAEGSCAVAVSATDTSITPPVLDSAAGVFERLDALFTSRRPPASQGRGRGRGAGGRGSSALGAARGGLRSEALALLAVQKEGAASVEAATGRPEAAHKEAPPLHPQRQALGLICHLRASGKLFLFITCPQAMLLQRQDFFRTCSCHPNQFPALTL